MPTDAQVSIKAGHVTKNGMLWINVLAAPVLVTAPIILAVAVVGTLLVYVPGIYIGTVTSTDVQFLRNGIAIAGATNPLGYTPVLGDVGASITVQETVHNGPSSALMVTSNSVTVTL